MDLVYQRSKHPLALLSRPLQTESDLHLLAQILSGDLVHSNPEPQLSDVTPVHEARRALWLLLEITQGCWWARAWTFQENYRGGGRMHLLIPHDPSLEQQKVQHLYLSVPAAEPADSRWCKSGKTSKEDFPASSQLGELASSS
ncbi:hypothetical protein S7711_11620 [Stachybotrys chartarum IBT 7711]|uniref:Heterokaryon incompatibility domain-containing protein n=1 Tax=Stachybotrys chartarum (strain CBS 109288 / IBT 7711) TaxID=1280523 RepID=A0A084B1B6_STACB|nr:hypothetical protein S7711_11620 [Stachybotrys chartarum IBT 7711]